MDSHYGVLQEIEHIGVRITLYDLNSERDEQLTRERRKAAEARAPTAFPMIAVRTWRDGQLRREQLTAEAT